MTLRRPGVEDGRPGAGASLSVSEFVGGRGRSLASVAGAGLARMRPAARQRLAALMLTRPRVGRVATPGPANTSLVPYVGMARTADGVTVRTFRPRVKGRYRSAAGVAAWDGTGLALLVGKAGGPGCQLERYGDGPGGATAERALREVVRRWREAGCPSLSDCEITVTYGGRPPRTGEVAEHDGTFTTLRWPT